MTPSAARAATSACLASTADGPTNVIDIGLAGAAPYALLRNACGVSWSALVERGDELRPNFVAPIGVNERPWWWRSDCCFGRNGAVRQTRPWSRLVRQRIVQIRCAARGARKRRNAKALRRSTGLSNADVRTVRGGRSGERSDMANGIARDGRRTAWSGRAQCRLCNRATRAGGSRKAIVAVIGVA